MKKILLVNVILLLVCPSGLMAGYYDTSFDTPDAVDDWTVISGTWALDPCLGEYQLHTSQATCLSIYDGSLEWDMGSAFSLTNYTVNTEQFYGTDAGVVARYTDASHYYLFRYNTSGGGECLQIYRWSGGATKLAEIPFTVTAPYTLSFTVYANELTGRIFKNDAEIGSISVLDDAPLASGTIGLRTWIDDCSFGDLHITSVYGALNIAPREDAVGVSRTPTFRWAIAEDIHGTINPDVKTHYLYISEPNPTDPNAVTYVDTIALPGGDTRDVSYDYLTLLDMDSTYYWRVVEGLDDGQGGVYPPGDSHNLIGKSWFFETIKSIPSITQQPEDVFVKVGETAEFSVEVVTISLEHYQWFKVVGDVGGGDDLEVGTDSETYTIPTVAGDDEGLYYCIITNDGGSATSDTAALVLKVLKAHWTLNESDYTDGKHSDIVGGHNATSVDPNYITGMDGTANGAVVIEDANDIAVADTWNPSGQTNKFSISLWVNWDGDSLSHQCPISKQLVDPCTCTWRLIVHAGSSEIEIESSMDDVGPKGTLIADGQWQQVCVTFDGLYATMYINGEYTGKNTLNLGTIMDSPIVLGAGNIEGSSLFNGALDDISIYNYCLSNTDVADVWYEVTRQSVCLDYPDINYDVNHDCQVDVNDFAEFLSSWLECGLYPKTECY